MACVSYGIHTWSGKLYGLHHDPQVRSIIRCRIGEVAMVFWKVWDYDFPGIPTMVSLVYHMLQSSTYKWQFGHHGLSCSAGYWDCQHEFIGIVLFPQGYPVQAGWFPHGNEPHFLHSGSGALVIVDKSLLVDVFELAELTEVVDWAVEEVSGLGVSATNALLLTVELVEVVLEVSGAKVVGISLATAIALVGVSTIAAGTGSEDDALTSSGMTFSVTSWTTSKSAAGEGIGAGVVELEDEEAKVELLEEVDDTVEELESCRLLSSKELLVKSM